VECSLQSETTATIVSAFAVSLMDGLSYFKPIEAWSRIRGQRAAA
jgi:hypothetical protein